MSKNNESATQNANVAFQLRAIGQQLELLSRMYKNLKDEVNSIKQQNSGADRRANTVRMAVRNQGEHEVMGRENQGEEQGERRPLDSAKNSFLQPIWPPIQTQTNIQPILQTNQTIRPQLKNTQIWPRVEVRQEE